MTEDHALHNGQGSAWQLLVEFLAPGGVAGEDTAVQRITEAVGELDMQARQRARIEEAVVEALRKAVQRDQHTSPVSIRVWTSGLSTAEAGTSFEAQKGSSQKSKGWGFFLLERYEDDARSGQADSHGGHVEEGLEELSQGLAAFEATRAQLALAYFRARLAEIHLLAGRQKDGLRAVEESLRLTEQAWWLPEQHRVRAELLLLVPGNQAEAEGILWQALEVARGQGSRSLELRLALSLARLLHMQGRTAQSRDLLTKSYAWFTEGFNTADIQEAERLLAVLE